MTSQADPGMGAAARAILDAIPSPAFVVEEDFRIVDCNAAASKLGGGPGGRALRPRGGEVLRCIHSKETPGGCGRSPACGDCILRDSANQALQGRSVVRRRAWMEIVEGDKVAEVYLLVTTAPFTLNEKPLALVLLEDISEVMALRRILPVCAYCRKVRNDGEFWQSVESYVHSRLEVDFGHGVCPDCSKQQGPPPRDAGAATSSSGPA